MAGVVLLYLGVNWACVRVLGAQALAATPAPATAIMERALGPVGGRLIAAAIAISTLGFLSQSMLTAPRVYFAMARDRTFFAGVGRVHPRSRVPVVAIALQGGFAMLLTTWGGYRQILDYLIAVDFLFFGLTATCLFVFRRRDGAARRGLPRARPPVDDGRVRGRLLAVRRQPRGPAAGGHAAGDGRAGDGDPRVLLLARPGRRGPPVDESSQPARHAAR